jgi:hypothetical protein
LSPPFFLPLSEYLKPDDWPFGAFFAEGLEAIYIQEHVIDEPSQDILIGVRGTPDFALRIPGLEFVSLALAQPIQLRIKLEPLSLALQAVTTLRIRADILRPISEDTNQPDMSAEWLEVPLGAITFAFDDSGGFHFSIADDISVPRCTIGTTGLVLEIGAIRWLTPDTPNPHVPPGSTGIYLDDVRLGLPNLKRNVSSPVFMEYAFLDTGGFTGLVSVLEDPNTPLAWNPTHSPAQYIGGAATGELSGFQCGLRKIEISIVQNCLQRSSILGELFIPYLNKRVGIDLKLGIKGDFQIALAAPQAQNPEEGAELRNDGLLYLKTKDLFEAVLDSFSFQPSDGNPLVHMTGKLRPLVANLNWPEFKVRGLLIDSTGKVRVDGGWLDLPEAKTFDFYGFKLELTKFGFGTEESGEQWIGLNGAAHLAAGMPIGGSVEGLRIIWNPKNLPLELPRVELRGVGVDLEVPGAFAFKGKVAFFEDKDRGSKGFRGEIKLTLHALNCTVDGKLIVGQSLAGYTFFYIYLSASLPAGIPLFNTGAAIYGFQGLVAVNMEPNRKSEETWYEGWYKREPIGATATTKWDDMPGSFALGLGVSVGTATDDGFSVNTKTLLILVLPGPVILLEGKGNLLKTRPGTQELAAEGAFTTLLVLDMRQRIFQMNLEVNYSLIKILNVHGGVEVFFNFDDPAAWHIYLGQKEPESKRIGGSYLNLFRANVYYMRTIESLALGGFVGYKTDPPWKFGPLSARFEVWMAGDGTVSLLPQHLEGKLQLYGLLSLKAFGTGLDLNVDAEAIGRGPTPYVVDALIQGAIRINLLVKTIELKAEIPLHWEELAEPVPPEPLLGMAAEHFKTDEAWEIQPIAAGTNIPPALSSPIVIPPDARPLITFTRPLSDDIRIGQGTLPDSRAEVIIPNEYEFRYRLRHVELLQKDATWAGVSAAAYIEEVTPPDKVKLGGALSNSAGFKGGILNTASASYEINDVDVSGTTLTIRGGVMALEPGPCLLLRSTVSVGGAITAVADQDDGTSKLTINVQGSQPLVENAYAGGWLKLGAYEFVVLGNSHDVVDVLNIQEASGGVIRPVAGDFTLSAPSAGVLFGQWLPTDQARPEAKTKLQLWSKTQYTYFRRNDASTLPRPFDVCGADVREEPICVGFQNLQDEAGREISFGTLLSKKRYQAGILIFMTEFTPPQNSIEYGSAKGQRMLHLLGERGTPPSVKFAFDPPLEMVDVYGLGDLEVLINGTMRGNLSQTSQGSVRVEAKDIQQPIQSLTIRTKTEGTGSLTGLCFMPGWTCAAIPRGAVRPNTDPVQVAGITFSGKNEAADALRIISKNASALAEAVASYSPSSPLGRFRSPALELANIAGNTLTSLPGTESALARIHSLMQILSNLFQQLPGNPPTTRQIVEAVVTTIASLKLALSRAGSLRIEFPAPVTRVRLSIRGRTGTAVAVKAFGGTQEFQTLQTIAQRTGQLLLLNVTKQNEGWINRIEVIGLDPVVTEVCYDGPEFASSRQKQYSNRQILSRQLEYWYSQDPVFKPETDYCVKVVTDINNIAKPDVPAKIQYWYGFFRTGMPPIGQKIEQTAYPGGGLLADLSSYVFRSIPDSGAGEKGKRPHYRRYGIGVEFNENYVDRLYLQSHRGLAIRVLDNNGRPVMESANHWGTVPHRQVSTIEAAWVGNLNSTSSMRCATVNWQKVAADRMLLAAEEGMLLESQILHRAEVVAKSKVEIARVYAFEFTTSKFANFLHHIHSFEDTVWNKQVTIDASTPLEQVFADAFNDMHSKVQAVQNGRTDLLIKAKAAGIVEASDSNPHPTRDDFMAYEGGVKTLHDMWEDVEEYAGRWHTEISRITGLTGLTTPQSLEVSLIKTTTASKCLLLHSSEPIDWRRTKLTLRRLTSPTISLASPSLLLGASVKVTEAESLTASDYYIELLGREVTSLDGYRLEVASDNGQLSFAPFFTFSKDHLIPPGKRLRVHAPSHADREPSVEYISQELEKLISGQQKSLPSGIVWIRLIAPSNQVVHQQVMHPAIHYQTIAALALFQMTGTEALLLPSKDGSQAFVLLKDSNGINFQAGRYLLEFQFLRDVGPEASVLREAGRTSAEFATIQLQIE